MTPDAPVSDRQRLADLAAATAGGVNGVASLATGGPYGPTGVRCTAAAADPRRYAVEVALVAELTDLTPLAAAVRDAVVRAAELAGLGDRLGAVDVHVADVVAPA